MSNVLKALGLDLRKLNTVNLYKDVDAVLQKACINNGGVSPSMSAFSVAHSLQKMFNTSSSFSICTIRDCADLTQIVIRSERMKLYSTVHCVSWSEMELDFRNTLIAMVLDDFRSVLNPAEYIETERSTHSIAGIK